jgi:hypothetical protein
MHPSLPPDPLPDEGALGFLECDTLVRAASITFMTLHGVDTRFFAERRRAAAATRLTTKYVFIRSLEPLAPPLRNPSVRNRTIRPEPPYAMHVGLASAPGPKEEGARLRKNPRACRQGTIAMETSRQYRQHAADCLQLASEASDAYVKVSLTELATEFRHRAEAVEELDHKVGQPGSGRSGGSPTRRIRLS